MPTLLNKQINNYIFINLSVDDTGNTVGLCFGKYLPFKSLDVVCVCLPIIGSNSKVVTPWRTQISPQILFKISSAHWLISHSVPSHADLQQKQVSGGKRGKKLLMRNPLGALLFLFLTSCSFLNYFITINLLLL